MSALSSAAPPRLAGRQPRDDAASRRGTRRPDWPTICLRLQSGPPFPSAALLRASPALRVAAAASQVSSTSRRGEVVVSVDKISKSHSGNRELFSGLSFSVSAGDRVAVIGPNGSGKSTLLRVVGGQDEATSGVVAKRRGLVVGFLEQEPDLPDELAALEAILSMDTPNSRAVKDYEAALSAVERGEPGSDTLLSRCTATMDAAGGWELASTAKEILNTLGIVNPNLRVADLSGGQRRRVALAAAMLSNPDLMLLDEPTNHMDVDVIKWMSGWLNSSPMAVLFVTHDRHFMETVATNLLELDSDGSSHFHKFGGPGSYERFQNARQERRAAQAAVAANAKTLLRTETEWMRRQPKARSTKSKARIDAFYELTKTAKSGPLDDLKVNFEQGKSMKRQGKKVMELKDASFVRDSKTIFKGLNYEFQPGEKIGIVGPNGCGKSTLLDILAGKLQLTEGEIELGEKTAIGYFMQHPPPVREDMRVVDYLKEIADDAANRLEGSQGFEEERMSPTSVLDQVGFPRERHYQVVGLLSGGERRRLHLAAVLMGRPNFLILDEITNDLDLQTVEMVEQMLESFSGVLITVSHDYQFMENNVDRLFVFEGDGVVRRFDASYGEYMEYYEQLKLEKISKGAKTEQESMTTSKAGSTATASVTASEAPAPKKLLKLGFREKQEYEGLEAEIEKLGEEREHLDGRISECNASGDYEALAKLTQQLVEIEEKLETKENRWLELAERSDIT